MTDGFREKIPVAKFSTDFLIERKKRKKKKKEKGTVQIQRKYLKKVV
jgi:hypothetical protein